MKRPETFTEWFRVAGPLGLVGIALVPGLIFAGRVLVDGLGVVGAAAWGLMVGVCFGAMAELYRVAWPRKLGHLVGFQLAEPEDEPATEPATDAQGVD